MLSDVLLVHQTLCGDENAYHRLMKKYETDIYTFILSWVKNPADAEEMTQDVFMKAYQNLSSLREPSRFYPWLIKIAKNQCHDWKRKKHDSFPSMQEVDFNHEIPPADELIILREAISKVLEVVETLPEVEKNLLKERYLEDVSYKDLQTRHGLSYKGVAMRLFKARRKVREKVLKILSGIVAFPWRDAIEKLFLGGIEAMKISAKTKLVTVWTAALLIVGGITVSVWYTKPSKQEVSKPIATRATQKVPQQSPGYSFPKQKPFVTPVQKSANQTPAPDSVKVDKADWEILLTEFEKTAELEEDKIAIVPEMEEELTEADIQAKVDSIIQEIYDKVEEYRGLNPQYVYTELARLPQTPEVIAQGIWVYERRLQLQGFGPVGAIEGFPHLFSLYYEYTKDKAAFEPGGWINTLGVGRVTIEDPGEEDAGFSLHYSPLY